METVRKCEPLPNKYVDMVNNCACYVGEASRTLALSRVVKPRNVLKHVSERINLKFLSSLKITSRNSGRSTLRIHSCCVCGSNFRTDKNKPQIVVSTLSVSRKGVEQRTCIATVLFGRLSVSFSNVNLAELDCRVRMQLCNWISS